MKRSAIVSLALAAVLTLLAFLCGGDLRILLDVQAYFLIGMVAVLLVAYLNTRHELPPSARRDRFCLQFVTILTSCVVCLGLLLTLIALVKAIWCVRHLRPHVGDVAMSLLPFTYCLAIAEIVCPLLSHHFGCRIERADHTAPKAESNGTA